MSEMHSSSLPPQSSKECEHTTDNALGEKTASPDLNLDNTAGTPIQDDFVDELKTGVMRYVCPECFMCSQILSSIIDFTRPSPFCRPLTVDPMLDDAREREAAANLALLASGGDPSVLAAAVAAAAAATRPLLTTPSPLASPAASVSSTASAPLSSSAAVLAPISTLATTASPRPLVGGSVSTTLPSPAKSAAPGSAPTTPGAPSGPAVGAGAPSASSPGQLATPGTPPAAPTVLTSSPSTSANATLSSVAVDANAVDSPFIHDEASLDGEQFEPILSDEDIEDDGQVGLWYQNIV